MKPALRSIWRTMRNVFIVLVLLLLLLGFILPHIGSAGPASRKSQTLNDLVQLKTAIETFHADYGYYPVDPKLSWKDRAKPGDGANGIYAGSDDIVFPRPAQ